MVDLPQTRSHKQTKDLHTDQRWKAERLEVMKLIIEAQMWCVPKYRRELFADKQEITEPVPEVNYWSCDRHDLSKVILTKTEHCSGKNVMGKLHVELRDKIQD